MQGTSIATVAATVLALACTAAASCSGTCADVRSSTCSTGFVSGLCPGSSSIKCCRGALCHGQCADTNEYTCSSGFQSGVCAGAANIKCCSGALSRKSAGCPGTCADVNSNTCSSGFLSGRCPGASNIQCCTGSVQPKHEGRCSGTCANTDAYTCSNGFASGLCPGASNVQCCTGSLSPRGGSSCPGTCADIESNTCSNGFISGKCPGASNIQCCTGRVTPAGHAGGCYATGTWPNSATIAAFFRDTQGITNPRALAVIMGNLQQESDLNPLDCESHGRAVSTLANCPNRRSASGYWMTGVGLLQWSDPNNRPGRRTQMFAYCRAHGLNCDTASAQLQFLAQESEWARARACFQQGGKDTGSAWDNAGATSGSYWQTAWRETDDALVCPDATFATGIRTSNDPNVSPLGRVALDCVRVATGAQQESSAVISFEGSEGDWGTWDQCEGYSFAAGMQTLSQESQGRGDDTALNGVQLACSNASGQQLSVFRPHSSVGPWGTWDQPQTCSPHDESGSDKDDTGLNRIVFICRSADTVTFSGELGNWGEWSEEYLCPPGHAVSAIQTRLQARQGRGDDTALNGIRMRCQSTEDSCGGCLNGGTCAQTTASCQCTADFGGQHCEIDRTRRLSFNSQNKFRIVQFTDLHYNIGSENDRTDAVQRTVLQLERPDLVVITGDELSGTSISSRKRAVANWNRITAVASSMGIKWALVFGNHDDDGPLDRQEMFTLDSAKTGSLTLSGPADLYGESNYYLPIFSGANLSGTAPASVLWMLGVTDGSCEGASGEGCVTRIQVDWFQRSAKELSQRWNKVESPFSLMFFHIPVPEFAEAWESNGTCFGTRGEKESSPNANTGLFDAAYNLGVRGMFVGHDHKNDLCGALPDRPQLLMCYGRKSGYGYYNPEAPTYRGARVIELALGPTGEVTMDTWIRDEWGYKIIKTYVSTYCDSEQVTRE
eukprot:m51a1_g13160 hypothetical protein (950) ;mRNA; f:48690-54920